MKTPLVAFGLALGLALTPAFAQKPEQSKARWAKNKFDDDQRGHVRVYFEEEFRRGLCPPGLDKKNNGCRAPGWTRKWSMGKPIPAGVVVYDVPPELQIRIGLPPAGHKYVRIAGDILLIAIGTKIVVDAVRDLGRG